MDGRGEREQGQGGDLLETPPSSLLRAVLDAAPAFIALVELSGAFRYLNRMVEGYSLDDVVGATIFDFIAPGHHAAVRTTLAEVAASGQAGRFEVVGLGAYGRPAHYDVRVGPVVEDGNVVALALIATDVSERLQLESQLQQAQKMDAVGKLAAGVAHNFNNMLMCILPNIQLAERRAGPGVLPFLREAREAGKRAAELVRQLTVFARPSSARSFENVALAEVAERVVSICRSIFPAEIRVALASPPELPELAASVGQIEQVLLNICLNARDAFEGAMPADPSVELSIERLPVADLGERVMAGVEQYQRIRVVDNGCGMDESVRSRIFEPFYTTKEVGRGLGLGLATSYSIVAEHGGWIDCRSSPGDGTTFDVYLPENTVDDAVAPSPVARPATRPGGARIAVIDDEPLVRRAVRRVLEEAGYTVFEATDGVAGLRLLAEQRGIIDLVLLDLSMPRMGGPALLDKLRADCPDLPVVILTGALEGAVPSGCTLLRKPVMPADLVGTIARVLADR